VNAIQRPSGESAAPVPVPSRTGLEPSGRTRQIGLPGTGWCRQTARKSEPSRRSCPSSGQARRAAPARARPRRGARGEHEHRAARAEAAARRGPARVPPRARDHRRRLARAGRRHGTCPRARPLRPEPRYRVDELVRIIESV
jgi:hypothetical protein